MRLKLISIIATIMLVTIAFTACTTKNTQNSVSNGGQNKITIVTSFYPMYVSTLNVTKDIPNVNVVNMTKPQTGCLHDYQITPEDLKTLETAKVFVINGAGMESFMEKVIKQYPNLKIVDASRGIELIKNASDGEDNPHLWVSISNAISQVNNIGGQLAQIDTTNAQKYEENINNYVTKLESQRSKMHNELDGLKNRDIVTFHEAFPYFAKEFNLNIVSIIEREPGSEPSAKELSETIDMIKKSKVKALFAEPQYSTKAAQSIAEETGSKVYTLDPAVTGEMNENGYLTIMDKNLEVLKEALK